MTRDLNETLIFVKVVEQGSFIAAANALGLPKTTVSRKVQELEQRLGARLLHRTTRRIGLTEAGSIYHEHCQRIARELEEAESAVGQLQSGPRGWLRFTVPYSIGITWIADGDQGVLFRCESASPNGFNLAHWCNPEYDKLDDQQVVELDRAKRLDILKQMSNIVSDDAANTILFFDQGIVGNQPRLKNFFPNGYGVTWSLNWMWVTE